MQLPTSSSNAEKQPGVSSSPDDKPGMASYGFHLSTDSMKISKFAKCPMRTETNDFFALNCDILKNGEMMYEMNDIVNCGYEMKL